MRERTSALGRLARIALAGVVLAGMTACADASNAARGREPAADAGGASARPFQRPSVTPSPPMQQPRNIDFEHGSYKRCPYTWMCTPVGKATYGVVKESPKTGAYSMKVELADASAEFVFGSELVRALPQRSYTARIYVKSSAPDRDDSAESIRLRFYDKGKKYIGSGDAFSGQPSKAVWQTLRASAESPSGTAYVSMEVILRGGPRSLWLDAGRLANSPILHVWPETGVSRGDRHDTLVMQLTTPTPEGVRIGAIDAFGSSLHVASKRELVSSDGGRLSYTLGGPASYDAKTTTIRIVPGGPAKVTIRGRFTPTPGTSFPKVVLKDPVARASYSVHMGARNFDRAADGKDKPPVAPDREKTLEAVRRLSRYLDTRMEPGGGWKITHPYWPKHPRTDPQGIAVLTQGYLTMMRVSDESAYATRARRGLDWLVKHQRPDGGYGLPWPFGSSTGHFGAHEHYEPSSGKRHPDGYPLAVVTIAAGNALLEGYTTFGDEKYLDAANRTMNYLLRNEKYGFRWLDKNFTRGSIPYCDLEPILPPDDPRIARHDVLPALRNTSVEVYNIDAAAVSFIASMYQETGDKRLLPYGDALATNLASKIREDGSVPYSWYESSPHSAGYASIVYRGLLEYGEFRDRDEWREAARKGYTWLANEGTGLVSPDDAYAKVYGTDWSLDIAEYVRNAVQRQRPDGAFSDGTRTRHDAVMFAALAGMLVEMGGTS